MGLLEWLRGKFRKAKAGKIPLSQITYTMAYYLLSIYCLKEREKLRGICEGPPKVANLFFYVMACQMLKTEPLVEHGLLFQWHLGRLEDGQEYMVLEYPKPEDLQIDPVLFENSSPEEVVKSLGNQTLAPFFSGAVYGPEGQARYLVLAQSLVPGQYTLRECFENGSHGSLGSGPDPSLANFLACLSQERELQTLFQPPGGSSQ